MYIHHAAVHSIKMLDYIKMYGSGLPNLPGLVVNQLQKTGRKASKS